MQHLAVELQKIYDALLTNEPIAAKIAETVHPDYQQSAKNLYRYLVLRSFDLRNIHDRLSEFGISSMRTAESYVWKNLTNSLRITQLLLGNEWQPDPSVSSLGYESAKKLLKKHANRLFNPINQKQHTEIMVTMPSEAADNVELLRHLMMAGMEIARINLSHDNLPVWQKMVDNLHTVSRELGTPIKIYMDLAGPKIRTGSIAIKNKKGKIRDAIRITKGEHIVLTNRPTDGKKAVYGEDGKQILHYAEVGVTLPQIIDDLQIGDPVFFDDGLFEGKVLNKKVLNKNATDIELVITKAHKKKLKGEKGINLPETQLRLPALTEQDLENLPFVSENADIVGYSFVRTAQDVQQLYHELAKLGNEDIGVVFKIENKESFENLAGILIEAMKRPKIGVMIARGDLAVELGYERISEVQQQILWFCEAAHVPVIWATQVLENLAKAGVATRAEVSDAAMSAHAECVMLNKGPYIVEAIRMLKQILVRMEAHGSKKKPTMRALNAAKGKLAKLQAQYGVPV
ncbi:MAG: pyruvate kinase [Bacteroidota bacterium]